MMLYIKSFILILKAKIKPLILYYTSMQADLTKLKIFGHVRNTRCLMAHIIQNTD